VLAAADRRTAAGFIGPRPHLTVLREKFRRRFSKQRNRAEIRARVALPRCGKRYIAFGELLVGRADCPFFLVLTAARMPSAGIILDL
jgi:hypothetical protein